MTNGDFSQGLGGWTTHIVTTSFGGTFPQFGATGHGHCVAASYGDSANINVPSGAVGYIEQTVTLPEGTVTLTFKTWGEDDPTDVTVFIVNAGGSSTLVDSFSPPSLFQCQGFFDCACVSSVPGSRSVDLSSFHGQTVRLQFRATSGGVNGTFALFDDIVIDGDPAQLTATLTASATAVVPGDDVELTLVVRNPGGLTINNLMVPAELTRTGEGTAFKSVSSPPLAPMALAPGAQQTFQYIYVASQAGPVTFSAQATGVANITNDNISSNVAMSAVVNIQLSPLVAVLTATPTELEIKDEMDVVLRLTNSGVGPIKAVTSPVKLIEAGDAQFETLSGPEPALIDELAAGASADVRYRLKAKGAGTVVLTGEATGMQGDQAIRSNAAATENIQVQGLEVRMLEPVQVVYGVDLVAGKPTLVRATLVSGFVEKKSIDVLLEVEDPAGAGFSERVTIELDPGDNAVLLPRTGHFALGGPGKITVTLDPENTATQEQESKKREESPAVHVIAPLGLRLARMTVTNVSTLDIFTGEPVIQTAIAPDLATVLPSAEAAIEFLNAVYPLPAFENAAGLFYPNAVEVSGRHILIPVTSRILNYLSQFGRLNYAEKLIAYTPDLAKYHTGKVIGKSTLWDGLGGDDANTTGEAKRNGKAGMVTPYMIPGNTRTITPGIVAHELGHTFGLPLPQNGSPCGVFTTCEEYARFGEGGRAAGEGVWVRGRDFGLTDEQIKIPASARNFMGVNPLFRDGPKIFTWVAKDDYEHLLSKMRSLFRDPEALLISFEISQAGEVTPQPWYTFWTSDLSESDDEGTHAVRLLDAEGRVLAEHKFSPTFIRETEPAMEDPTVDATAVTMAIKRPSGLAQIEIVAGDEIVFERDVTASAPVVEVIAPEGGETLAAGKSFTLSWKGSDADGDALHYALSFSDDNGATWSPVVVDLDKPEFDWTAPDAPTRFGLIRIFATDGVNTFDITTQPFTITGSGESSGRTGLLASAGPGQQVKVGAKVTLDGRASRDTSDLDAVLTHQWRTVGVPTADRVELSDATAATPTFTAAAEGRYLFELVVSKGGQQSKPSLVTITALAGEVVQPPTRRVAPAKTDTAAGAPDDESPVDLMQPDACGAGACGAGVSAFMPLMFSALLGMKRRPRRQPNRR
ncbi:Ser-Thr-rich glycosyl-phosphatidyl-inositol-anchored membrane family protein [Phycisphaerae bacterium RAS1]|nr:Ser-Thr-rich glycosyl-phosphatidyl-inositol-anchored membrane family protein [Phycisphaerae bacterium RAS1]